MKGLTPNPPHTSPQMYYEPNSVEIAQAIMEMLEDKGVLDSLDALARGTIAHALIDIIGRML